MPVAAVDKLSQALTVRDLNEIITRNAHRFIEDAKKAAQSEGRDLSTFVIAGRMAETMGRSDKSVDTQLRRHLKGEAKWRADYIEALAAALGRSASEFVVPQVPEKRVSEATVAQALYNALGQRLSPKESRTLIRRLHRLLDRRPLYDLAMRVVDVLLDQSSKNDAAIETMRVVERSAAWDVKSKDLRGKRKADNKSG